jgi:thiol-disulfide isomerase/thioredoxin
MNVTHKQRIVAVLFAILSVGTVRGADGRPRSSTDLIDRFDERVPSSTEQAGVGIAFGRRDGQLFVHRVLPETPAALSGKVHVGDRLIAVGQGSQPPVEVKGMSIEKVVPMIRGTKGTLVMLTIVPVGKAEGDAIVVPLTRGVIKALNLFGDGRLIPPGTKAPDFEAVVLPDGRKYELKSSVGKIVVLEFWASGCAPCLKLLDHLQDLRKDHPEWKDRVEIVAIGTDEKQETASRCLKTRGGLWTDLTVVWGGPRIAQLFHVAGFPGTFLLDEKGRVVAADPKTDLVPQINRALSAAAGGRLESPRHQDTEKGKNADPQISPMPPIHGH